ncbi:substrate-binding domain-containing protein [Dactylosporangium aurantiacum]|uniref:Substrate-binding domain-containing protein n=1 Tax=Dactylosporangium aurantiacum TaxID=35754 RepID=A0A9Q9IIA2_9ACTN|nr:VWA domain-containing protein [Dactylosporangium aurantiacum]MDG6101329.1 substrate-binding domain-containing protein [Dactylosporangium aurantiacum]UWZ54665.1 substrate-binding domain-containing protein [Dactylosporangium aurantiacum]
MEQRRRRSLRAPLAIVGVLGLIGGTVVAVRAVAGGDGNCDSGVKLVVAAAPDIAPAVRDAAARWSATKPEVSGDCVQVQVRAAEPADVANQLAARAGGAINVAATALPSPADADVPTVWIPDSTAWLVRMRAVSREAFEPDATSVATSPVTLAVPDQLAGALNTGGTGTAGAAQVAALLPKVAGKQVQLAAVDPRRSTAGLAGAGLLYDSIVTDPKKLVDVVKAYRSITVAPDQAALSKSTGPAQVAPMSEQAVIAYNSANPAVALTAMPVDPPVALDYPYASITGKPRANLEAAELFRTALTADSNRDLFARLGFRAADGSTSAGFPAGRGATTAPVPVKPLAEPQKINDILGYWNATTAPSRVLTLVDVTSSVNRPMAGSGSPSRLQVLRKTATEGLGLFTDDSELGLWAYASGLPGGKDYQEVVPLNPLNQGQRARLTTAVSGAKAVGTDVCGLYETVLAAYKALKDGYKEGRSNTVVVFTDGANSKPGMSLETLKLELERATDPTRPVRVVLLGVGPDARQQELAEIAAATGGRSFVVTDPDQIGNIFLQALIRTG